MSESSNHYDVAILGGGFSGGLLAWVLAARGMRVLLVERDRFGRFAIGESSTPMADLVMRQLAEKYAFPKLHALSTYPSWKQTFPNLRCGKKRGFSYYHHGAVRSDEIASDGFHDHMDGKAGAKRNSLLVTASPNDTWADTHWLRSDVDAFFVEQATLAGADCRECTQVVSAEIGEPARLILRECTEKEDERTSQAVSAQCVGAVWCVAGGLGRVHWAASSRSTVADKHSKRVRSLSQRAIMDGRIATNEPVGRG